VLRLADAPHGFLRKDRGSPAAVAALTAITGFLASRKDCS
jgi:hypothetical protein